MKPYDSVTKIEKTILEGSFALKIMVKNSTTKSLDGTNVPSTLITGLNKLQIHNSQRIS